MGEQAARAPKQPTHPEPVGLERTGDTLTVTLQRPEVRNAVDQAAREVATRYDFKGTDVDQPRNLAKTVTVE